MSHPFPQQELQNKLVKVLEQARHRGMDAAEAFLLMETGFAVSARQGEVETVEHHQARTLHVTVYHDQRSGATTTSDLSMEAILAAVDKACAIAHYAGQDPYAGLADPQFLAVDYPDLQLYHHWNITPAQAIDLAIECDTVAREQDPRITDAEGSSVSTYDSFKFYGNTQGFIGCYPQSLQTINCGVVAQSGDKMQSDHEYTSARSADYLDNAVMIAKQAAQKALQRLDARRLTTRRCPVIFHAPVAKGLLSHFIGAISGRHLYQKATFLVDSLGKKIFPEFIHIYQEPHMIGGMGSAPFDSEGVRTRDLDYIKDGVLQNYVLGSYSARKLAMQTTGNAGGVFNLGISHNNLDLTALLKKMDTGLFVTDLMGQGINLVTGAYSRGAIGFWVERGEIQYPVNEITIAGQLQNMFANLIAVANDTDIRGSIRSGSILIGEMTIAGE
jgi:PmbA protein